MKKCVKLPKSLHAFNNDFHLFWSTTDWEPKTDCHRTLGNAEPECCGSDSGPKEKVLN